MPLLVFARHLPDAVDSRIGWGCFNEKGVESLLSEEHILSEIDLKDFACLGGKVDVFSCDGLGVD